VIREVLVVLTPLERITIYPNARDVFRIGLRMLYRHHLLGESESARESAHSTKGEPPILQKDE